MDKPYKFFCLGNVLIDKGINYLYSEDKSDKKAIRMKNIDRGTFGSLYDLTYDSTKIIDRLYF